MHHYYSKYMYYNNKKTFFNKNERCRDIETQTKKQNKRYCYRVVVMKMFVTSNMTEALNISSLLGQSELCHSLPLSVAV